MIQQVVTVGDKVNYHGSQEEKHGDYFVAYAPEDVDGRGYVLVKTLKPPVGLHPREYMLSNVHRDSFTLVEANVRPLSG